MTDFDAPLEMMLRLLGSEYSDTNVARAALDLLDPEVRKELTSRLAEEPEPEFYTIQGTDVGKHHITAWGERWQVINLVGKILPQDVGKRITRTRDAADVEWVLHVESNVQLRDRLAAARLRVAQEAEEAR